MVWQNLSILFGLIPICVITGWLLLRGMDKLNGISFKEDVYPKISESPVATSIYFGLRFIGVLYVIATLFSRFV